MSVTKQVEHIDSYAKAGANIPAYRGLSITSAGVATLAGAGDPIDGISLNDASECGSVHVLEQGLTCMKVATAAGITAKSIAAVNATGQLIALAGSSNKGNVLVVNAPAADGDLVQVYFDAYNLSNITEGAD